MEAKINKITLVLTVLFVLFLSILGVWDLTDSHSRGFSKFCFFAVAVLVVIIARAVIISVKRVSSEGLERGDGSSFKWADLKEVKDIAQRGRDVYETRLCFKEGESARLSRAYHGNYDQLRNYVSSMVYERQKPRR